MFAQISIFTLLCLSSSLSQYCYIGGLPIINILFLLLIIQPHQLFFIGSIQLTIPILYAILLGGSFYAVVRDRKKISKGGGNGSGKYALDFDLVSVGMPVAASGALFGVLGKNFISDLILTVSYFILMIYLIYKQCRHKSQLQSPSPQQLQTDPSSTQLQALKTTLLNPHPSFTPSSPSLMHQKFQQKSPLQQQLNPQLQKILDEQNNRLPKSRIKLFCFVLLYTFAIILTRNASSDQLIVVNPDIQVPDGFLDDGDKVGQVKGEVDGDIWGVDGVERGKSRFEQKINRGKVNREKMKLGQAFNPYIGQQGLSSCVVGSFLLILAHLTLSYLSSKSVAIQITTKDSQKQKYGYVFYKESDKMGSKKMWNLMISNFFGGFIVGIFGIGSSIVVYPIWTQHGVQPETSKISSTCITFISSLISLILYIFTGYQIFTVWILLIIAMISALSLVIVDWIIKKITHEQQGRISKVMYRVKMGLYVLSLLSVILYGIPADMFVEGFGDFGHFC